MTDGFIVTNRADAVVDINPSAEKMLGIIKGDILGMRLSSILEEWPSFTDLLHAGTEKQAIIQHAGKHYDVSISPVYEKPGETNGYIMLLRDVSDQVKSNRKLVPS
jgi:PAS domain S-box-containing protein